MKKIILAGLIMSMAVAVQAQDGKPRHHNRMQHHGDAMKNLNLTEDQKAKFKTQNESFRKQMAELKKNENITVKEWKTKMEGIRKAHKESIKGILTTEQKAQMEKARAERVEKFKAGANDRAAKMNEKLGLTEDQQAKMKTNRAEMQEKMKSIRENKSLDDAAKKEKMKELMKGQKEKMKSILTEDQLKKMQEGRKQHHHKGDHSNKPKDSI